MSPLPFFPFESMATTSWLTDLSDSCHCCVYSLLKLTNYNLICLLLGYRKSLKTNAIVCTTLPLFFCRFKLSFAFSFRSMASTTK